MLLSSSPEGQESSTKEQGRAVLPPKVLGRGFQAPLAAAGGSLACGSLSFTRQPLCMSISMSTFPLFIKILLILDYMPTLQQCYLILTNYMCNNFISK